MTVYVDNMLREYRPRHRPGYVYKMSHMIADSDDELHAMAKKIGVARKWFQGDHYDIAMSKRTLAIEHGAQSISLKLLGMMASNKRAGCRMGDTVTAERIFKLRYLVKTFAVTPSHPAWEAVAMANAWLSGQDMVVRNRDGELPTPAEIKRLTYDDVRNELLKFVELQQTLRG